MAVGLGAAWRTVDAESVSASDRKRLKQLIATGALLHPVGPGASVADLACSLALCRGIPLPKVRKEAEELAAEIGRDRKHIVFVLCDGMGCSILDQHLGPESFLRRNNQAHRLTSVFPSTTPAVLTSLASASWPGQHGAPGWDLRDQRECEVPGNFGKKQHPGLAHLRILHPFIVDSRSGLPVHELGYTNSEVFIAPAVASLGPSDRTTQYVSAYEKGDFCRWSENRGKPPDAEDQTVITALIPETEPGELGTAKGADNAVEFFRQGVDKVLAGVTAVEQAGKKSYTHFYSAHPDKHMHSLGVEHHKVQEVVRGFDAEAARLWKGLEGLDAALVLTADHGHVTVTPQDMIVLPVDLLECLEYANVGVHGKGRHACMHCKPGCASDFEARWASHPELRQSFLLLKVDDAAAEGLFGPDGLRREVRPRLGDFLVLALGAATLVTKTEADTYRNRTQGAHGSLLSEEMRVPLILCTPDSKRE